MLIDLTTSGSDTVTRYRTLLKEVDIWFAHAIERYPGQIRCTSGCSECCRSLFDITILDAACLKEGFDQLPPEVRETVTAKARKRLGDLRNKWPDLDAPFVINYHQEEAWQ